MTLRELRQAKLALRPSAPSKRRTRAFLSPSIHRLTRSEKVAFQTILRAGRHIRPRTLPRADVKRNSRVPPMISTGPHEVKFVRLYLDPEKVEPPSRRRSISTPDRAVPAPMSHRIHV